MADDKDAAWRERLPEYLQRCVEKWSLTLDEPLTGGYLAAVYGCTGRHGEDLVLKLSPPLANPAIEARALDHWRGNGAAKLVAWDESAGALLLERIRPGSLLMDQDRSVTDDELAVRAASWALAAMQSVPPPAVGSFPSFEEKFRWWLDYTRAYGEADAAGTAMLPLMERAARALDASARYRTLAHGDFLAKNLLLRGDGRYVAVDPLPYSGDPASDCGHFSAYHSPVATVIPRARAIAEATGNDPDRAAQWAAIWTVGEACETWREDSDELQAWVAGDECQELLASCVR